MKLYLFAFLSIPAAVSASVVEAEVPIIDKINKEGRLTLFNSRRMTGDCLPICQPDSPTDAPVGDGGGGGGAPPVDPPTDAPVDPPTDAPVGDGGGGGGAPPVDPPTDAPVDPPTDAPVDPPTDAPVDPPTDAPVGDGGGTSPPPPGGECPPDSNWSYKCGTTLFVCGDWAGLLYDADTGYIGSSAPAGICSSQAHTGLEEAFYGDAMSGGSYVFPAYDGNGSTCDYMEAAMRNNPRDTGVKCGQVCLPCTKKIQGKMVETECCASNSISNFVCYDATPNKFNTEDNEVGECN